MITQYKRVIVTQTIIWGLAMRTGESIDRLWKTRKS